jgi:AcrR family transcriptional regulator
MADAVSGRANQKRRTRKAMLDAARRLMSAGRRPSFDEVAEEALVSRATAYRYFSGIEPLLVEAALDLAMPDASLFDGDSSPDPVERLLRADRAVDEMIRANETAIRTMLVHALQQQMAGARDLPARQNRRTPLIEAALAPASAHLAPAARDRLVQALALFVGTESLLVFDDVLQLDPADARSVKDWAIRTLVEAAAGP